MELDAEPMQSSMLSGHHEFVVAPGGQLELGQVTPAYVRQWHASLTRSAQTGLPTVAKAYRLLKTIFTTAVEDELIGRNPCVLKGVGVERSAERPVVSIADVDRLVAAAPEHMKALILTATYTALRFGELAGLRYRRVYLDGRRRFARHQRYGRRDVRRNDDNDDRCGL